MKPYTATQLIADREAFMGRMSKAYWTEQKKAELLYVSNLLIFLLWDSNNTEYWGA